MRFADVEDFSRSASAHELLHHLATEKSWVLDLAVELAVREQTGTAFAELNVRLWREHALAPQSPSVLSATSDVFASLENDGSIALLREDQCCEQTAGSEAYDNGSVLQLSWRTRRRLIARVRRGTNVWVTGMSPKDAGFVSSRDIDDIDEADAFALFAGIVAALEDGEIE